MKKIVSLLMTSVLCVGILAGCGTKETSNLSVSTDGSTSMEKFINAAAKAYADLYHVNAEDIFDIQLEGSKRMNVTDFLRGRKIEKGTSLG